MERYNKFNKKAYYTFLFYVIKEAIMIEAEFIQKLKDICYTKKSKRSQTFQNNYNDALSITYKIISDDKIKLLFEFNGLTNMQYAQEWCYKYLENNGFNNTNVEIISGEGYTYNIDIDYTNYAIVIDIC